MSPLAIGLDVSELRLGYAIVTYEDQSPLALGVEDLRERDGGWVEDQVIRAVSHVRDEVLRLGFEREDVWVVGVEDAYVGPSVKGSLRHAAVVGMARAMAASNFGRQTAVVPIGADEWRGLCGISNAGKSADKKAATEAWAWNALPLGEGLDDPWGWEDLEQDAFDALGVATACALLTVKTSEVSA